LGGNLENGANTIMSHFSINRVVLVGRLTRDGELRALPSGLSVCGLRIACNSSRKDSEGAYRERPNYFDVDVYGVAAENVARYTGKGSRVAVDGHLEWREWESADEQRRQAVSIVAETVQFLDGPGARTRGPQEDLDDGLAQDDETVGDADGAGELVGVGAGSEDDLF
jgi:single-strand DNA-binding protein